MFQHIAVLALEEPAIGYAASYKFRRAINDCPKCGAPAYVRLKGPARTTIGVTCSKCTWISTFLNKARLPKAPKQAQFPR